MEQSELNFLRELEQQVQTLRTEEVKLGHSVAALNAIREQINRRIIALLRQEVVF